MSMTATPDQQRQLLELQALDSQLSRIRTQLGEMRHDEQLSELRHDGAAAVEQAKQQQAVVAERQSAAQDAERTVSETIARRDRLQQQLDTDKVSSRDVQAVTIEIAELTLRIESLEMAQLEAMQALEDAQTAMAHARDMIDEAQQAVNVRIGTLNEQGQQLTLQGQELAAEREALVATLPAGLVKEYEQLRDQNQGVGALELKPDGLSGAGLPIAPAELAAIQHTPAHELAYCPDTGAILVRN